MLKIDSKRRLVWKDDQLIPLRRKELEILIFLARSVGMQKYLEIEKELYEKFNSFELQDLSYMNVVDRHLEQSEIWDSSLYERAFQKKEGVEDAVIKKLKKEQLQLHNAIEQLSEIQKRRLIKYCFEDKNYEQIAQEEGCSFWMVAKSVKAAIRNLKKILR